MISDGSRRLGGMHARADLRRSGAAGRALAAWPAQARGRPARARPAYRTAGDAGHRRVRPGHAPGVPRRGRAAGLVLHPGWTAVHRRGAATGPLGTVLARTAGQRPGALGVPVGDHGAHRRRGAARARSIAEPARPHRRLVVVGGRPGGVAARADRGIAAIRRAVRGAGRGVTTPAHLGPPGAGSLRRRPGARARRASGRGGWSASAPACSARFSSASSPGPVCTTISRPASVSSWHRSRFSAWMATRPA